MNDFRAPRWLPGGHVQTIWPVLFSRRFDGAAPVFRRERWATPRRRFRRRRLAGRGRRLAAARALSRPRGIVVEPLRTGLRRRGEAARLALRGAALSRLLGRDQPGAARLPLGRPRGSRLDAGALSCPPRRADRRRRRLARRQCLAALRRGSGRERGRARARGRRRLGAARPRRRRPRDRPRLRPPGLYAHVHAHDEEKGARQARPASRPVRRRGDARGARPARFRRDLHRPAARLHRRRRLLRAQLGESAPGPHPHSRPGAERAQRSVPARLGAAAGRARSARA